MSMTIRLNVRESPLSDRHQCLQEDLNALYSENNALKPLFATLGVKPLSTFFDRTNLVHTLRGTETDHEFDAESSDSSNSESMGIALSLSDQSQEPSWPASAASWHDVSEVLASAQALLDHLDSNEALRSLGPERLQALIDDLQILVPALQEASALDQPVHLLMVL